MFPCPMIFNIQSIKEKPEGLDHVKEPVSFIQYRTNSQRLWQQKHDTGPSTEKEN